MIRVKKQILVTLHSGNTKHKTLLLVVPQLNVSCVFGKAAVKALTARTDLDGNSRVPTKDLECNDSTNDQKEGAVKLPTTDHHHPAVCSEKADKGKNPEMSSSRSHEFPLKFSMQQKKRRTPSRNLVYKDLYWRFKTARLETTGVPVLKSRCNKLNSATSCTGQPRSYLLSRDTCTKKDA